MGSPVGSASDGHRGERNASCAIPHGGAKPDASPIARVTGLPTAQEIAGQLSQRAQAALRWPKYSLNQNIPLTRGTSSRAPSSTPHSASSFSDSADRTSSRGWLRTGSAQRLPYGGA